jgi:two-component system, chemotaxis family, CheB/CheR fusion protein
VIERQSRHMARLLDDLLDVSRITRGDIELRKENLDLRKVVTAALEAVAPLLEERKAELVVSTGATPLGVDGDPARLQQVVGNLLSNAARYSPAGSRIWLTARGVEDSLLLTVKDEGCGIPRDMLAEIFELFVQADQGLDRPRGGLGVGLTLVRKIVELHGGSVEARSDGPGTGSELVVRLPRAPLAAAAPAPRLRPSLPAGGCRIVIVEDQQDAREVLRLLLEAKGHTVIEAADGAAAIEVIARERPDVALVDIGLPVIDGYAVARAVRADSTLAGVVLVALSGYGSGEDVQSAREAGFDDHLTKPAEPERIDALLRRHHQPCAN